MTTTTTEKDRARAEQALDSIRVGDEGFWGLLGDAWDDYDGLRKSIIESVATAIAETREEGRLEERERINMDMSEAAERREMDE